MKRSVLRFLSLCLAVVLLFPLFAVQGSAVSAAAFCLMDADTGEILAASNENAVLPMASTTKIMTCLVALEEGDVASVIAAPKEAVGTEGSSIYLQLGEKLTLLDLLYALMLQSANDAAVTIAIGVSGSVDAFVARMNEKAAALGMTNTHFVNPHGLPAEGHHSTARDMATLMAVAMGNEAFAEISGTQTFRIPEPSGSYRYLSNHNRLLKSYADCVAGKTGFTKAAGRCLVTAAKRGSKTLVCATLNAPSDWNDHKSLFESGFARYQEVLLCEFAGIRQALSVVGGELYEVTVTNLEEVRLMLPENTAVTMELELPRFLYAPVAGVEFAEDGAFLLRRAGVSVGDAVFYADGREVSRVPLYPMENVPATPREKNFLEKTGEWIRSLWERITEKWKK